MKINISAIENENAISEVQASAGEKVIGGLTTNRISYIGTTSGEGSGQEIDINTGDTNSNGTSLQIDWRAWA